MKHELGDGLELDDDKARVDREAVHRYLGGESYWAKGRLREVQDRLQALGDLLEQGVEAVHAIAEGFVGGGAGHG